MLWPPEEIPIFLRESPQLAHPRGGPLLIPSKARHCAGLGVMGLSLSVSQSYMTDAVDEPLLPHPAPRRLRLDLIVQRLALVAAFVGIWWLLSLSVPHYILPGPARVWEAL